MGTQSPFPRLENKKPQRTQCALGLLEPQFPHLYTVTDNNLHSGGTRLWSQS